MHVLRHLPYIENSKSTPCHSFHHACAQHQSHQWYMIHQVDHTNNIELLGWYTQHITVEEVKRMRIHTNEVDNAEPFFFLSWWAGFGVTHGYK